MTDMPETKRLVRVDFAIRPLVGRHPFDAPIDHPLHGLVFSSETHACAWFAWELGHPEDSLGLNTLETVRDLAEQYARRRGNLTVSSVYISPDIPARREGI